MLSGKTRVFVLAIGITLAGVAVLFWLGPSTRRNPADSTHRTTSEEHELAQSSSQAVARGVASPSARAVAERERAGEARQRRDALRESIYRGLGRKPPGAVSAAAPSRPPPPPPDVPLDRKYIQERIRSDFVPLAKQCYETLLAASPGARGKAVFSFVIVGDAETGGIVESVDLAPGTTLSEPEFAYCVRESLLSLTFAPPPSDGWVTVTYPIDFSPDSPSDAG